MKIPSTFIIFLAACLLLLIHHWCYYYGHFGFDDLYYARLAKRLFDGQIDWADHYSYRIVPLAVTGLSYRLFGINDTASALPGLLCSVGILYLLYRHFREEQWWQLLLACGLYFSLSWNLFYSDKLMPDLYVSCFTFAAWSLVMGSRSGSFGRKLKVAVPCLAAGLVFLAFNSKGTVILAVPIFGYYAVRDLLIKKYRFWLVFGVTSAALLLLYGGISAGAAGSPLARFSAIGANHYLNDCSYDQLPTAHLISRLTDGFWTLIVDSLLVLHLAIAVAGLILVGWLNPGGGRRTVEHVFAVAIIFLSIDFMSISLTSYNPICLDPRHILLFSPMLCVLSVRIIGGLVPARPRYSWLPYLVAVVCTILLLIPAYRQAEYGKSIGYAEVQRSYRRVLTELPRPARIYGSGAAVNYGEYYTGFAGEGSGLVFGRYEELPVDCGHDSVPAYVIQNWYVDWHDGLDPSRADSLVRARGYQRLPTAYTDERFRVERLRCE
ncbi:MAG: hypothetical protein WBA17_04745 [Saprospiraceae bacterium]